MLTNRQFKILEIFINIYNKTSKPVSSAQILSEEGTDLELKSAAIRMELAVLEKEGYIQNSYKTSGRIPTNKSYKYFLNKIENNPNSKLYIKKQVKKILENRQKGINWVLKEAISLVDSSTKPLIITKNNKEDLWLEDLTIYNLNSTTALIIASASDGEIYNNKINISGFDFNDLNKAINLIAKKIVGQRISDIKETLPNIEKLLRFEIENIEDKFDLAIRNILERMLMVKQEVSGKNSLITTNYFRDLEKLKTFFDFIDSQKIWDILEVNSGFTTNNNQVIFDIKELNELAVIKTELKIGKQNTSIALISPKGQKYNEVFEILEMIEKELNDE